MGCETMWKRRKTGADSASSRPGPYVPSHESERDDAPAHPAPGTGAVGSVYLPAEAEIPEDDAGQGSEGESALLSDRIRAAIREYADFPRPGILFRDISPIFLDPELFESITVALAAEAQARGAEIVVGIESRGFLLGTPVALSLNLPFVPVRKRGKLPGDTVWLEYDLEYGTEHLELQRDSLRTGARVVLVDDLLATGGTAVAAARLIERVGGILAGIAFLVELSELNGRAAVARYNTHSLLRL